MKKKQSKLHFSTKIINKKTLVQNGTWEVESVGQVIVDVIIYVSLHSEKRVWRGSRLLGQNPVKETR